MSETRQPLPAVPGQPERYDYEYRREGVANTFMFFAPLLNWRHVKITERQVETSVVLADERYQQGKRE